MLSVSEFLANKTRGNLPRLLPATSYQLLLMKDYVFGNDEELDLRVFMFSIRKARSVLAK